MAIAKKNISTSQIVDSVLYQALINENKQLREALLNVSSVGISAMFHTHRFEAESFNRTVLKGVAELMSSVQVEELNRIYEQGYELASAPSVLEKHESPHLRKS